MAELVLPSGAIKVIQTQQNMVGGAIAGGAGSVANSMSGDTIQILEDLKEISLRQYKGLTKVAKLLADTLNFDKAKARREKDQASELAKEKKSSFIGPMSPQGPTMPADKEGGLGGGGLLAGLGIGSLLTNAKSILGKIIKPFKKLLVAFGSFTRLTPLLGRLAPMLAAGGPIGLVIGGLFLLVQYSDEIVKALSPAIDKIAQVFKELQPIFDIIMEVLDSGIKMGITTLGASLSAVGDVIGGVADLIMGIFDTVSVIFTGAKDLIDGKISGMDFVKLIWDQGIKKILMAPINMLKNLGETMFDFIKGLVKSLPFGIGDKLISGMKGMTEGSQAGTAGDIAGETSMDNFSGGDTITSTAPSASGAVASEIKEPKAETVAIEPKPKPKTVNMDKTSGVTKVVEKITGDPNLPPLGLNMYKTTGDTYDERAKQWYEFKDALVQAEKDGSITKDEIEFRVMQLKNERDSLKNAKKIVSIGKQRADLKGETFDEASKLKELDSERSETQKNMLAAEGMTVASYDEAVNNKLKPNVNKRNLDGDGAGSQGSVTVVNNQPSNINTSTSVAKNSISQSPVDTSSGDSYFDKQANNINV